MSILSSKRGFTLIEIMTALVILAVSLVALLGLRNRDIALSAQAAKMIEATLLARQKISEFSLMNQDDTDEAKCDFNEKVPYRCEWAVTPGPHPLVQELVVRVFWNDQGHEQKVQLTKYLFDQT